MKFMFPRGFRAGPSCLLLFSCFLAVSGVCQTDVALTTERTYPYAPERIKQALQQLGAFAGGKLPLLDGFVSSDTAQLDRYERPYYQYRIDVSPLATNRTQIRVKAMITAWYSDARAGHAGYRSLVSNGRLESELLDRLQESLASKFAAPPGPPAGQPTSSPEARAASETHDSSSASAVKASEIPSVSAPDDSSSQSTSQVYNPALSLEDQLDKILAQRRAAQEKTSVLTAQIQELEAGGKNPPTTPQFVSVRRSGAGVMTRTNDGGPVLFRAQAEDEFEIVERQGDWAQVRLGPDSTGWIRASELDIPEAAKPAEQSGAASGLTAVAVRDASSSKQPDLGFWVSHQDVSQFSGDWSRLKGKRVLFVYAQPRGLLSDMASDDRKLGYAKRVFAESYRNAAHSGEVFDGVVVIFMGGKGGIAAATLADIRQWVDGALADDVFVSRCSLDPPDEFRSLRTQK